MPILTQPSAFYLDLDQQIGALDCAPFVVAFCTIKWRRHLTEAVVYKLILISVCPTAPCPPTGIVFSGNSSFAKVSWNRTVFATTYTLYDNSVKPRVQLCNTTTLSCSLFNLISNNLVITASNTAGESQAASVPNGRNWSFVFMCTF